MVGPVGSFAVLGLGWAYVASAVARDPAAGLEFDCQITLRLCDLVWNFLDL